MSFVGCMSSFGVALCSRAATEAGYKSMSASVFDRATCVHDGMTSTGSTDLSIYTSKTFKDLSINTSSFVGMYVLILYVSVCSM
jgi:hypothetical protein